ncbi:MAG: DUF1800 domain-containing protein [Pyrinomonadaceae bacterium]|nr:DUF1800 domain-containing protein [Pyrinomonadaceae bacterium]MCX7639741.1 DUF1800 domain-containing protein [Pyrinomonadaceae bacterium]MDW8304324.1 DUF1800 domain-containing protein [Acidobacteriota bacterium]
MKTCKLLILALSLVFFIVARAQDDPNPDSPTPILISHSDSTRTLSVSAKSWRGNLPKEVVRSFPYGTEIVIFVTNLDLLPDEGANAFRVYIQDAKGREFRLPVLEMRPVKGIDWIYGLIVQLKDEVGYWQEGPEQGDVLMRVSWRGLTSNRTRLSIGFVGGKIEDDPGAKPTPAPLEPPKKIQETEYVGYRWSGDRMRFLQQATFGPTKALDNRIRRIGIRAWLEEQFNAPYPTIPYPDLPLMPSNPPSDCNGNQNDVPDNPPDCYRQRYGMYSAQKWFYQEAFYGEAQLRHRVAWALSQIWVISGTDIQQSSHMIAYFQVLARNAFGNWRQLMYEMTLNPGMGEYLDMARSTKNNPNENYAREILQLFNVGLFMLNPDGTYQRDAQGNLIPTYDQNVVNNFTKVFTGWSFCEDTARCPNRTPGAVNFKDPMLLRPQNHDLTAKTLLNYPGSDSTRNIPACTNCSNSAAIETYANNSLNQALDNIYNHPNVAPFISRILIQHLVTSDPSPAYVARVAATFNANRSNPRQLKEVVKAILLDPEARGNVKTEPNYGKLREPVQLLTNLARQFDVMSADRTTISDGVLTSVTSPSGQVAFMAPSVFNYYPPDFVIPGTTLNAPEFAIYTTGTAIARANMVNTLVFSRINTNSSGVTHGTSLSFSDLEALAAADPTSNQLLDELNWRMMNGNMSAEMRNRIITAVNAVPSSNPLRRAQTAVYLIATSSQYQIQR